MKRIRVLVVDDSVLVRKMVTDVLSADPEIEIAGIAANGKIALQRIQFCAPDLVTMDVEMPEMDGIQAVKKIKETNRNLPIIMFSTITERGGLATLDALAAGAADYVTKPSNTGSIEIARDRIRTDLIPKIKALVKLDASSVKSLPAASKEAPLQSNTPKTAIKLCPSPSIQNQVQIVAIGISTGGPNALAEVIPLLPETFPVPIVIVQHMPALFTKMLAERLGAKCKLKVHEAHDGQLIEAGNVYIAPGDFHMQLRRQQNSVAVQLDQGPQENSCRPSVNPLFESVANLYGPHALGLIMTGMGQDGVRGCRLLQKVGASIVVQDEQSSVVWGMPGFVATEGLAEKVIPLQQIAAELMLRVLPANQQISKAAIG